MGLEAVSIGIVGRFDDCWTGLIEDGVDDVVGVVCGGRRGGDLRVGLREVIGL